MKFLQFILLLNIVLSILFATGVIIGTIWPVG